MRVPRIASGALRRGEFVSRRLNGGLHYGFAYGLTAAELRDGGDFDIAESGSIGTRRALTPFTTKKLDMGVKASWAWQDRYGYDHMFIVMDDNEIRIRTAPSTGFVASPFGTMTGPAIPHAWSAGGFLYVSDGVRVLEWPGHGSPTATDVTTDSTKPIVITPQATDAGVPANGAAATYRDIVFIGNVRVKEGDPDAIAWSLAVAEQPAGDPLAGIVTGQRDFYENNTMHFISGSGGITKLVSSGPGLYAFKRHSVHALTSSGATILSNDLSTNLGLAGQNAVCAHNGMVWFFDEHEGLHVIQGNSMPEKVFDPIFPLLDCGRIGHPERVAVGFDGGKVFVSVCLDGATANNVTFVLNTNVSATSKGGSWSKWDVGFDTFCRHQPGNGDSSLVGICTNPRAAVKLNECSDSIYDDFGFMTRKIATWFRTAFFDDALPTLVKRWDKIALTFSSTQRVNVSLTASTGPGANIRNEGCELPTNEQPTVGRAGRGVVDLDLSPAEAACFDPCITLGVPVCDTDSTGVVEDNGVVFCGDMFAQTDLAARVARIASPGRGVSFSMEVRDLDSTAPWTIDEVDVKYSAIVEAC